MTRRLVLLLLALVLAGAWPGIARADDGDGGDNAAVAINTKDDSSIFRLAFKIRRVAGDIVDNSNAAVAFNSCERCESVAIAIQIVLVTGSPSTVTPENLAIAINQQCTLCVAFASAYQFVVSTGGPVRFTAEGLQEIAAIKRALRALRREEGLSPAELQARIAALMDRLKTVLRTQLVPAGPVDSEQGDEEDVEEVDEPLDEGETPTGETTVTDGETVTTPTTTSTTTETTPTTTETQTTP